MAYNQLKLDNQVCFRLYTAERLVTQSYSPYFKAMGITYPQYLVLLVLWEQDNRLVGDITDKLRLETNTVTPLLQRMEKQGLIVRNRGNEDSRQRVISLTAKGKQLEDKAKEIPECLVNNLQEENVSVADLVALSASLDKLISALSEKKKE